MASDFGLDRYARAEGVHRIRAYFERERGEELGELAAGFFLDFVAEELGPLFYNAGLADAQALLARFVDSLDADIEAQRRVPSPLREGRPQGPRKTSGDPPERPSAGLELRTARLLLRPFQPDDRAHFAEFVDGEAYLRYLSTEHPPLDLFMRNNLDVDWDRECAWVICLGDTVVGSAFLGVSASPQTGELAYLIAPAHWGEGIATEAAGAVLGYAFGARRLAKVAARADERNLASLRVMEKLGLTREGLLRAQRLDRVGGRHDEVVCGILAEEWIEWIARPATHPEPPVEDPSAPE